MKRKYTDNGTVVTKLFIEAKEEREITDFKTGVLKKIAASEEKYFLNVISCQEIDKNGMVEPQLKKIQVDKTIFEKVKYETKVELVYEMSQFGDKFIELKVVG